MRKIAERKGPLRSLVRAPRRGIAFTQANRESSCVVGGEKTDCEVAFVRRRYRERFAWPEDIDRSIDDDVPALENALWVTS